jgi:hypothetical protein
VSFIQEYWAKYVQCWSINDNVGQKQTKSNQVSSCALSCMIVSVRSIKLLPYGTSQTCSYRRLLSPRVWCQSLVDITVILLQYTGSRITLISACLATVQPWRWRQYVSLKCQWTSTRLYGIATQKTVLFTSLAWEP